MPTLALPMVQSSDRGPRDYLSYSAVNLYRACPKRFEFKYVLGWPETTVAASLVLGGAFHACLQHYYEQLLMGRDPAGPDELLDIFWDAWHRHGQHTILFNQNENLDTIGPLIDRMLTQFLAHDLARPRGIILGVEEELRGPIVPDCPDVLARLDLLIDVGDAIAVIDFKTSQSRWNERTVMKSAPQLHLYAALAQPLADGKPLHLAFAVMTKAKRTPTLTLHPVPCDPSAVDATLHLVQWTWRAIQRGLFPPKPSPIHCLRCPFQRHCPAGLGP